MLLKVGVLKRDVWVLRAARAAEADVHYSKNRVFKKEPQFSHRDKFIAQDTTASVTWLHLKVTSAFRDPAARDGK